jgi:hypothetical protein
MPIIYTNTHKKRKILNIDVKKPLIIVTLFFKITENYEIDQK